MTPIKLTKTYQIIKATGNDFSKLCESLFFQIKDESKIVRLTFFSFSSNDLEYCRQYKIIKNNLDKTFPQLKPTLALVSEKPLDCDLVVEVTCFDGKDDSVFYYRNIGNTDYIAVENEISKQLFITCNFIDFSGKNIGRQSDVIFSQIESILTHEQVGINNIERQWNYIPQITNISEDRQHYQLFNDSRSRFYAKTTWGNGYPAATGIGVSTGGVVICIDAVSYKTPDFKSNPMDNSLQVAAHEYSSQVLVESGCMPTTPKFERARIISSKETGFVYISGTAAIRGEESVLSKNPVEQTKLTMENIGFLVSDQNIDMSSQREFENKAFCLLRIYVKNENDFTPIHKYMKINYPHVPQLYVLADVCRDELLVEIEGVVVLENKFE